MYLNHCRIGDEVGGHGHEVVNRMGLGEEISEIMDSFAPFEYVVATGCAFLNPVVLFGDHFGSLLFAGSIGNGPGDGVVVYNNGGGLRMAEVSAGVRDRSALSLF